MNDNVNKKIRKQENNKYQIEEYILRNEQFVDLAKKLIGLSNDEINLKCSLLSNQKKYKTIQNDFDPDIGQKITNYINSILLNESTALLLKNELVNIFDLIYEILLLDKIDINKFQINNFIKENINNFNKKFNHLQSNNETLNRGLAFHLGKLPQGLLPLTEGITVVKTKKRWKKYVISINIPQKHSFYIAASSEKERNEWVEAITNTTKRFKVDKVSLEDFKLLSVIGRGTYGKVMLVKKKDTKKIYAMKSLQKGMLADHQQILHTMSERDVLMRVRHPFLVGLHYSFQTTEKLYMALDYAPGGELFTRISEEGKLPQDRAKLYIAEIMLALDHLHKMDVVYRDLKPENVLLDQEGHIKITDFGLVKTDLNKKFGGKTSTFCGTPEYLAPEIILDTPYDEIVDWWSLGILLYEMLTGSPPFYSEDIEEVFEMIVREKLKIPFYIEDEARDLIEKLLDRNPLTRLGVKGFEQIQKHPFFNDINWKKVYNREYTPIFIPKIEDITDVGNFDLEFTEEKVEDSLVKVSVIGKVNEEAFDGFTFMGRVDGIGVLNN
ncbi:non-specific serine/threonine protein kinase [Anaeramoeba flamelloides]|uniref:non-specific serine/threonine protein kinase n=1 Tax=Anaeramoeba flamelloides TaxID=1746091 RepID=A0AAV7Z9M7_9EUKA|nr:non-specific serine/threonine protein kinase [Anaeramoeba flamelloides]